MAFLQISNAALAFGDRDILTDVSFNLRSDSKAALAGVNGSGKSTLMKVAAGFIAADSGEIVRSADCKVAYLPQSGLAFAGRSLVAEVEQSFAFLKALEDERDAVGEMLKTAETSKQAALIERQHSLQERLENSLWYRRDAAIFSVLGGLGFSRDDFGKSCETFSGGWQMRIALAKVLLQSPDILLLDEPTNYLDLEARGWLQNFLRDFSGGFLIVSHDRYFLDESVNEVFELWNGSLRRYKGNYSKYESTRKVEVESLVKRFKEQQDEIAKIEDFIRKFRYKPTKAAQVQERVKMLEKMERIEIPESMKKIAFDFPPAPHSGEIALRIDGLQKSYGEKAVIRGLNLLLERGSILNVAGVNGAGKSTLLRILAGEDGDFSGSLSFGAGIATGYFSQDETSRICGACTVLEYVQSKTPFNLQPKVRDLLGAFLFRGDDVKKPLDVLSGGEKSRIALLELLLRPVNLLILDEPTNHLDLASQDVLLEALQKFGGTVIFVSHDRSFIAKLATCVLDLNGNEPRFFPGDYDYYLGQIAKAETNDETPPAVSKPDRPAQSENQLSWAESKRQRAERQKRDRREGEIVARIDAIEAEVAALNASLGDPAVYSDGAKCREIQAEIDGLLSESERLQEEWSQLLS